MNLKGSDKIGKRGGGAGSLQGVKGERVSGPFDPGPGSVAMASDKAELQDADDEENEECGELEGRSSCVEAGAVGKGNHGGWLGAVARPTCFTKFHVSCNFNRLSCMVFSATRTASIKREKEKTRAHTPAIARRPQAVFNIT